MHALWVEDSPSLLQSASGRSEPEVWATSERRPTAREEPNVVVLLCQEQWSYIIDFHITGFWMDGTFFDSAHGKYLERCGADVWE